MPEQYGSEDYARLDTPSPKKGEIVHTVEINGALQRIFGGTITEAAERAWNEAGRPRKCQIIVHPNYRSKPFTLVPVVTEQVEWRCLEQEEFREEERGDG